MDPLSITASIAGLLTLSGNIYTILSGLISKFEDAPRSARLAATAVEEMKVILSSVQKLIGVPSSIPYERRNLIQVDYLIITLTQSVITLSEFESHIKHFTTASEIGLVGWNRLKWGWDGSKVSSYVQRLESHKISLTAMLNILQCQSDQEARSSREKLHSMMERIMDQNQDMLARLRRLEDSFGSKLPATSILEDSKSALRVHSQRRIDSIQEVFDEPGIDHITSWSFEGILHQSRVYRRTGMYDTDTSFRTSIARSHAWSIFSGLSLAEISDLSVIALPLYSSDLPAGIYFRSPEFQAQDNHVQMIQAISVVECAGALGQTEPQRVYHSVASIQKEDGFHFQKYHEVAVEYVKRINNIWNNVHRLGKSDKLFTCQKTVLEEGFNNLKEETFFPPMTVLKTVDQDHIIPLWAPYTCRGCGYLFFKPAIESTFRGLLTFAPQPVETLTKRDRYDLLFDWIDHLARDLLYLHSRGLYHGNIKPSSIVIDRNAMILLEETCHISQRRVDNEYWDYRAPWRGSEITDPVENEQRIDIFSLGAIFLEILTLFMGRSSKIFALYRAAGTGAHDFRKEAADSSFRENLLQVSQWIDILAQDAARNENEIFRCVEYILALVRRMLSEYAKDRPDAEEVHQSVESILIEFRNSNNPEDEDEKVLPRKLQD